jgi:rod shape determining protein RodA
MRLITWRHFDYWLLGAVAVLIIFGVAMIDSAVAGNPELIELNVVNRQIMFALVGLGMIIVITSMDYHIWAAAGRILYVIVLLALGILVLFGQAAFGAVRALNVGFAVVQPSELANIAIILLLSDFFARNQQKMGDFVWVLRSGIQPFILVGLTLLQPDLSTAVVLLVLWGAMLFVSGLRLNHLFMFIGVGALLSMASFPFLANYQQQRIINFFAPAEGARYGETYNVEQASISIGSGGFLGQGYGQASQIQLRFLKVRHTDFIFSTIASEFGFVGTVIVLLLLLFVVYRIIRAASLAHDTFGSFICYGVATLIAFTASVNIAMNLNLIPVTGLTLPFISQGGSSLLSLMLGIGLVESVVARQKMVEY